MKQRSEPIGSPNQGMSLNNDDFLTGEELTQTQIPNSVPVTAPPVNPNMEQPVDGGIPDLEKMEGTPNANRRQAISQMVDEQVVAKISTVEDQIQKDIQDAQKKKFE
ncbi:unnamed protein product, partial [marine sediment metagenome]